MLDLRKNKSEEPEFDSAGYTIADRFPDEPPYIAVSSNGKRCWEIKSIVEDITYKVWATSYKQALEMVSVIEKF